MPLSLALARKRCSRATAIASANPMPTKPLVATLSPERMRLTASCADLIFPSARAADPWRPGAAFVRMARLNQKGRSDKCFNERRGWMGGLQARASLRLEPHRHPSALDAQLWRRFAQCLGRIALWPQVLPSLLAVARAAAPRRPTEFSAAPALRARRRSLLCVA